MPQLIPYIDTRAAWSERDRAAHYREQADNFRRMAKMRIEDLGPGNFVKVECGGCKHETLIPASALLQGLRRQPTMRVLDLQPRLRCRECDARGEAVVSIRWGEPAA